MRTSLLLFPAFLLVGCNPTTSSNNPDGGTPEGGMMTNTCPAPTGAGTMHGGSVSMDETWTAAGSPHIVPYDLSIYAKLTLEPCAIVRLPGDKTVSVNMNGAILANGVAGSPVTIEASDPMKKFASIRFIGGTGKLSYTTIVNGGAPLNIVPDFQGVLDIRSGKSTVTAPEPVVMADHLTIKGSGSQGFILQNGGAFTPDSKDVVVTESAGFAATVAANLAGTIPPGTYTGNTNDAFLLPDNPGINWDMTMHDRGVPYYSGGVNQAGVTNVGAVTGTVVLTIEPNVKWAFKKGTGILSVDPGGTPSRGVLVAQGTMDKPIIFSSDQDSPAAGDWLGIWMGGDDPRNKLDWVEIQYAGKLQGGSGSNSCQSLQNGTTQNGGALRVYHLPPADLVTNTIFFESATNGIDRGWRDDSMPSLLGTNTFKNIAQCTETFPRDKNGACPMAPPCPKE